MPHPTDIVKHLLRTETGIETAKKAILLEFRPKTTLEFASAVYKTTIAPMQVRVRHMHIFVNDHWRVRREVLDNATLCTIDNNEDYSSELTLDRRQLRIVLLALLPPVTRLAVEALLLCPDLLL